MGAIVMPPVPAFYLQPQTVEDVASQVAARAIDLIGVGTPQAQSWNPEGKPRRKARGEKAVQIARAQRRGHHRIEPVGDTFAVGGKQGAARAAKSRQPSI